MERDDVDRARIKSWAKEARALADELVKSATGPAWAPNDPMTNHLAHAGEAARGVITDVRKDGWGNDQVSSLAMSVAARASDGTMIELKRSLLIRSDMAPRVGEAVEVRYDPSDLSRFVYRAVVELPADPASSQQVGAVDRVGRLRELADLFEQGLLTREEFDAEKARLLAE